MMKLRHLIENFSMAREALAHYSHDPETLDDTLRHFRISSNAVYPFMQEGQLCFLRMAPLTEKRLADVQTEIDLIRMLLRNGIPAAEPLPTSDGRLAFQLDADVGSYLVSAFRGVPGIPFEDCAPTDANLLQYGRLMGRMHLLLSQHNSVSRPHWREAVNTDLLAALGSPEAVVRACEHTFDELAHLPTDSASFGVIHYDFEPDNVFLDEQTQTMSVIDFDDSIVGWFAMDVEQAIDSLSEMRADAAEPFLAGYREVFPFSPAQEATRPLMRRYIDLRAYARIRWCLQDSVEPMPPWMPRLIARLNARLQTLEQSIIRF